MNKIIQIDKIEDGMVLSEPVLNQFSQILLPSGTTLSEFHKDILKRWNITFVHISSDEEDEEVQIPEEIMTKATEDITSILLWESELPIEKDIVNIAIRNVALKLMKETKNETN